MGYGANRADWVPPLNKCVFSHLWTPGRSMNRMDTSSESLSPCSRSESEGKTGSVGGRGQRRVIQHRFGFHIRGG